MKSLWSPPTTTDAWKTGRKSVAMVTNQRLTEWKARKTQAMVKGTAEGGWGGQVGSAKSSWKTHFSMVNPGFAHIT
jgi:hypothetical protein